MPILSHRKQRQNNAALCPAPGGGGWVPTDLGTALRLWIKADTGTTVTGTSVDAIADQSGNGFNLIQSTSGNRPTLNATGYNSHPSIDFTASNQTFLATQTIAGSAFPVALNLGSSCSFFFIGQYSSATDNFGRIISYLGPTTSAGSGVDYANADTLGAVHRNATNSQFQGTQNSANLALGSVSPATNIRCLMVYDGAANTATLYINNTLITQTTSVASFNLGATGILSVGASIQSSAGTISHLGIAFFTGTIAELLVTNTALDSTERGNLDTYVVARLGA